ncbi:MAG TPA: DJ-1/PfpI family protein [Acidobacteriota bacterium]
MTLRFASLLSWLFVFCLVSNLPAEEPDRPLRTIGFLVLPGVYNSELMAPYDVFDHLRFRIEDAPQVFTVAPAPGAIRTFEGLHLLPHYTFENAPPIDLLVVPSAEHNMDSDLENANLIGWVRRTGARARLLLSLCDGAFLLAQAGLLDELEATTFPGDQDRFAQMFPRVQLQRGISFVHDGKAVTSVGGAKSYDAALYLVEQLYGRAAAERIATGLVIDWKLSALKYRRTAGAVQPGLAQQE